ncbi:MAG: hypothetical protein L3K03_04525 [Thermoplasmata archaeon]|nr:hypothetical protein [Thermoplasmata archaeon]
MSGSSAPIISDIAAVAEVAIAVGLVMGMFAVRRGHLRLHMYLQSSLVLVNLPIVLVWMVPQFVVNILPDLPGEIATPYYLLPTIMLFAGTAAELLGVYILLVAGTNRIPERFRFRNYKLWMRTELVLWCSVVLFGLSTYLSWYVLAAPAGS